MKVLERAGEKMLHLSLMKVPCNFDFLRCCKYVYPLMTALIAAISEAGFGEDGLEGDILGGDEEGGGWDVGDEDLVLPPDLVSASWEPKHSGFS